MKRFVTLVLLPLVIAGQGQAEVPQAASVHDYDIVYVRAPRYGDEGRAYWPEVKDPIRMEPGADLMLLHPDGSEELLVKGGNGSVIDPFPSLDGEWIYYSYFHDQRKQALNSQRRLASRAGADIYKIHLKSRKIVRLTNQEWTPNTGVADWAERPTDRDKVNLGYGIFNLGPCPLPGGKVVFSSSRNGYLPNKSYTFPNLQLFVMDEDGRNVELIGHLNLGSALHPTVLKDGRIMFSSYEGQGLRDQRLWSLWAIRPDGTEWQPLVSVFSGASAYHFQTQLSRGDLVVEHYYNQNNNGFGSFFSLPPKPPDGVAPFGDPNPRHESNPRFRQGVHGNGKPRYESIAFSPKGLDGLTRFTHGQDNASPKDAQGNYVGKVTHPSSAPNNDLLLVWSPGPANDLRRPVNKPDYDGGIYRVPGGVPVRDYRELVKLKNDPRYNEMQPKPMVTYRAIYGIDEPVTLAPLANDGSMHADLPAGTPFGLVGTSSFYKRNTRPGYGAKSFDGLDPFNTSQNGANPNWRTQGADAGKYSDHDIFAVRILAMEPSSHFSYGAKMGRNSRNFMNHAQERLRILGEIPLRKKDAQGKEILDSEGNPDTSFLARIPADVPFTFQTLDRNAMVLNMSQTWHQLRPGEQRYNCGGCHAHAQKGLDFSLTLAGKAGYRPTDLSQWATLLKPGKGKLEVEKQSVGAVDVEYYRDIKPLLQRSCVKCHAMGKNPAAELVLDDEDEVDGYENTWHRLANDQRARYGRKPVIKNGSWRQTNASRYIRKFQSRRSLLVWQIYGKRLDGWSNADHPTEKVPGDPSTLPEGVNPNDADVDFLGRACPPPDSGVPPLSAEEKLTFARWVDLGAPISRQQQDYRDRGWFLDELRPTLSVNLPQAGRNAPLTRVRIGMHDYYSGLDENTFEVRFDVEFDGLPAGQNAAAKFRKTRKGVWEWQLSQPIHSLTEATLSVSVRDRQGNLVRLDRRFSVAARTAQVDRE
ncbi:MAG: hypothetical protein VCA55_13460 [Verrucomicrobiales bacterium]